MTPQPVRKSVTMTMSIRSMTGRFEALSHRVGSL
jgi:hypothetical protein